MLKKAFNFILAAIVLILSAVIAHNAAHFVGGGHGTILWFSDIIPLYIVFYMSSVLALGYIASGLMLD